MSYEPKRKEKENVLSYDGEKRTFGELKTYLRPPQTIPVAILLVEMKIGTDRKIGITTSMRNLR
jgi:hypothetical protein